MKLFDRSGKPVEVPDDQAQAALSSGQYGAPAGTQIPVRLNGQIGSIPIEHLAEALAGGEAEVVSQADYEKADLHARYGGVKNQATAFGTEALDTATLGLSNAVIGGVGGKETRKYIRKSIEENPFSAGAGVAAGIIAPAVADAFSGGALTPELAATVGEKVLARAGEKALLGVGEKAAAEEVGRLALRGAEGTAARGAEGAASRSTALARTSPIVLEDAPRGLPARGAEMAGDVVGDARGLPPGPGRGLPGAPEPRALPGPASRPGIPDAVWEEAPESIARPFSAAPAPKQLTFAEVHAKAVEDVASAVRAAAPVPTEVAEGAARVAVSEAAPTVQAYGKGVIRQAVEGSLLGPQRLVAGAGQAVEEAVTKLVGREAQTALGRIAQKAVAQAARGAVEGGAYGVGNELGHQFLQDDPELNGERLASAWFHGALLGGGFGGGLGALSQGGKEALTKVVGKEGISAYLTEKAGEHMWHAAGGTQKMSEEAEKYAGGVAKVGNLIRQDAEQLMGRTPKDRKEMLELSGLMQEKHTGAIDAILNRVDSKTQGKGPTLDAVLKEIEKHEKELRGRAANAGPLTEFKNAVIDALKARDPLTGVDRDVRMTFKQLRDFRRTADSKAKFNSTVEDSVRNAFREIRHDLETHVEAAASKHLEEAGLSGAYKSAKAGYQAGVLLEKAASRGVAKEATNQFLSLTDKLLEIPGSTVGHAVAGPIGALIAGVATGNASKFIRKNFDFVVSDTLAKLANVARNEHVLNAAQASNERVQKRVEQGLNSVKKALDGKEVSARPPTNGPQTFEQRREALLNVAAQHEAVAEHLKSVTSPLDKAAPSVASALMSASLKTLTYLMGALPKPPQPRADSLTPQLDAKNWEPSDQQKAAFNRKYDIATHPEMLLHLVATGELTVQHMESVKATHPKMALDAGAKLRKELDTRTEPPPPHMRPSMKLVLGVPQVDPALGRLLQSRPEPPAKSPPPHRPLKMADHMSLNAPKY